MEQPVTHLIPQIYRKRRERKNAQRTSYFSSIYLFMIQVAKKFVKTHVQRNKLHIVPNSSTIYNRSIIQSIPQAKYSPHKNKELYYNRIRCIIGSIRKMQRKVNILIVLVSIIIKNRLIYQQTFYLQQLYNKVDNLP